MLTTLDIFDNTTDSRRNHHSMFDGLGLLDRSDDVS